MTLFILYYTRQQLGLGLNIFSKRIIFKLWYQGPHYFQIRERSDFSFRELTGRSGRQQGDFWEKLIAINRNIGSRSLWSNKKYPNSELQISCVFPNSERTCTLLTIIHRVHKQYIFDFEKFPVMTVQLTAYTDKCWAFKRLSI